MRDNIITDVIIPAYRPGSEFSKTLSSLALQVSGINRLTVINTEEKYWDKAFETQFPGMEVRHITKDEFNHGTTRYEAAKRSDADIIVFMTQDAVPADDRLIEKLIAPIVSGEAAVSYARQLPKEDADEIERFTRAYNYPAGSKIKSADDLKELGIKTFFCSNVCAAYDKKIYDSLGGFPHPLDFNEDMIFAGKLIEAGYKISYTAEAKVFHSHDYSGKEQYERNYLIGKTQAEHPEVFAKYPSEGAGISMVKKTASHLIKAGKPHLLFKLVWLSGCKYLGYRAGKRSVK